MGYAPDTFCQVFPRVYGLVVALILGGLAGCATAPRPLPPVIVEPPPTPPSAAPELDSRRFAQIDQVARQEVAAGHVPGPSSWWDTRARPCTARLSASAP